MLVLGIETSCDETAAALYHSERGLLHQTIYSQVDLHSDFGGIVPELAARDHIRKLAPLIRQTCQAAGSSDLAIVEAVAYTAGPGLLGALLVGATLGRTLAWALQVPAVAVHHMEGHLLAPFLANSNISFPFLALLVSGGHTLLVQVDGLGDYQILGETLDDAAGEAFDKTAKLLGLGYPGGAALAKLAEQGKAGRFKFPMPMTTKPGLDFSFSGLKTHVMLQVRSLAEAGTLDAQTRADIALAFETAVVQTLKIKCQRAVKATGMKTLVVAGGVSANQALRLTLDSWAVQQGCQMIYPPLGLCTDNAAMIAYAGCLRLQAGERASLQVKARARWPMTELKPPARSTDD